jgi:hypothetical protein
VRNRAEEEKGREAEVKAIEAARYEREMQMAAQEAAEDNARRKEAYARFVPDVQAVWSGK